jgi:hypothetical protein
MVDASPVVVAVAQVGGGVTAVGLACLLIFVAMKAIEFLRSTIDVGPPSFDGYDQAVVDAFAAEREALAERSDFQDTEPMADTGVAEPDGHWHTIEVMGTERQVWIDHDDDYYADRDPEDAEKIWNKEIAKGQAW